MNEKTISLLNELQSEFFQDLYSSWSNRSTLTSWEDSYEYKQYLEIETKIQTHIQYLEGE